MTFYSFYFNPTSVPGYKSYNSAPSFFLPLTEKALTIKTTVLSETS